MWCGLDALYPRLHQVVVDGVVDHGNSSIIHEQILGLLVELSTLGGVKFNIGGVHKFIEREVRVTDTLTKTTGLPVDAQPVLGIGVICTPTETEHQRAGV